MMTIPDQILNAKTNSSIDSELAAKGFTKVNSGELKSFRWLLDLCQ